MLNLVTTSAPSRRALIKTIGIIASGGRFVNRKAQQGRTRAVTSTSGSGSCRRSLSHDILGNPTSAIVVRLSKMSQQQGQTVD